MEKTVEKEVEKQVEKEVEKRQVAPHKSLLNDTRHDSAHCDWLNGCSFTVGRVAETCVRQKQIKPQPWEEKQTQDCENLITGADNPDKHAGATIYNGPFMLHLYAWQATASPSTIWRSSTASNCGGKSSMSWIAVLSTISSINCSMIACA